MVRAWARQRWAGRYRSKIIAVDIGYVERNLAGQFRCLGQAPALDLRNLAALDVDLGDHLAACDKVPVYPLQDRRESKARLEAQRAMIRLR